MSTPAVIRRQRHGIRVQQITVTLPADQMALLRKAAKKQGITVSRFLAEMVPQVLPMVDRPRPSDEERVA